MNKDEELIKAFCDRFNEALDKNGIPPRNRGRIQYVAEMFLLSHAGAGKWVNGISLPAKNKRKEIAQRLNVNYEWLEFGKGNRDPETSATNSSLKKLPLLGFHEAANYQKHIVNFIGQTLEMDIDASDEAFIVYNEGTSMSGRFPEGTLLVFDPNQQIGDGDFVLAKTHQMPDCIFRQLVVSSSGKYLYPHDPRYKMHKLGKNDKVIAKLIQARMEF